MLFFSIKKDNNNIEERLNINEIITIPKIDISLGDSFYLEKEDNKLVVYDYNNKKLSEQELGEEDFYEIYNNKYIIIKNDKKVLLVDQNGNEIKEGTFAITVYSNNKSYIIIDNKLYNSNMEEVYELSDNLLVDNYINNKLYSSNIINDILILTFENKDNNMLIDLTTKEVSSNIYDDITIDKDKIIAVGLFNTYIYKLGTKKEINIDAKEEVDINIDEVIDKYRLDSMKDKIKDNEELFKKYAYIVENNNNLLEYKKQVMDMFDLIISNKEYLNELRLLNKLKELNITYADDLGTGVGATYTDYGTKVSLKEKDNYTLYHELTHFADFSFNNYNNIYNLYNCNNKYEVKKGYDSSCTPIYIDTNFITEAGAELYSGKYYTHELEAYAPAALILEALEYICGTKELNEWFFSSDAYFKKLWLEAGYTTEETEKIINSLSNRTKILSSGNDDTLFIVDTLIDLYKIKISDNFMNDNKFKYILRSLIDYRRDFTTSKYSSELDIIVNENNTITNALNNSLDGYTLYKTFGDLIIIDGKEYISSLCYKGNEIGALLIDYDFDNNKVLNYKYTLRDN